MAQAARIAINRTVAGVHFPVDSMAGQLLGLSVAEYVIARCKPSGGAATSIDSWAFDGNHNLIGDFCGDELFTVGTGRKTQPYATKTAGAVSVSGSDLLNWLWTGAAGEW